MFGDLKIWRLNLESAISTRGIQQFDSANRMFLLSKSPFYSFRLSRIFVLAVWTHSYDFHLIAKKKIIEIPFNTFILLYLLSDFHTILYFFHHYTLLQLWCYATDICALMINLRFRPIHRICDCYCFSVITNIDSASAKFSFIFRPKTQRLKVYTYIGSTVKWLDCQCFF